LVKETNTAILLLGEPESEHFINPAVAKITWILKDKDNLEKDYEHFSCPLLANIDNAISRLYSFNVWSVICVPTIPRSSLTPKINHAQDLLARLASLLRAEKYFPSNHEWRAITPTVGNRR
jgi:hypothetical protein